MATSLPTFLGEFVRPLLEGGDVRLRSPLSQRDLETFEADLSPLGDPVLARARRRRARRRVADPVVDDMSRFDLMYWMGLHNVVFFDHPQLGQVWASDAKWSVVEKTTAAFLDGAYPSSLSEIVARDVALSAVLDVGRVDQILATREGEYRYLGQPAPRRLGLFDAVGYQQRAERVRWFEAAHASPTERLLPRAFRSSPLTSLIRADALGGEGSVDEVSPLLSQAGYARAVVYEWARAERWDVTGAMVLERVLRALGLEPGSARGLPERTANTAPPASDASDAGASPVAASEPPSRALTSGATPPVELVGALLHLHVLKVVEMKTRVGVSAPERPTVWRLFFGLPLLLSDLKARLGTPELAAFDRTLEGRWSQYLSFVRGIIAPDELHWMRRTFLPALIEETSP